MRDQRPFSALARDCTFETGFNRGWSLVVQEYSMSQLTNTWDFHWFVCVFVSYLIQDIGIRCISPLSIIIIIQRLVQRFFPTMRSLFLREGREEGDFNTTTPRHDVRELAKRTCPCLLCDPPDFLPCARPPPPPVPVPVPPPPPAEPGAPEGTGSSLGTISMRKSNWSDLLSAFAMSARERVRRLLESATMNARAVISVMKTGGLLE